MQTRRGLSSFVRSNARLLSLIGALIVFITFIVRDLMRDQARDTVESFHAADALFQMRSDMQATRGLVFRTYDRLDEIRSDMPDLGHRRRTRVEVYLENAREECDELRANLQMERNLLTLISRKDALRSEFADIDARFKQLVIEEKAAIVAVQRTDQQYGEAFQSVLNLGMDCDRLTQDALKLSFRLKKHFEDRLQLQERRLTVVTWCSWFLYSLGWSLTFVGRYYDAPTGSLD